MRRIISLFLVLMVLATLQVNILAAETPDAVVENDYILYENAEMSMIITDEGNG